MRIRRIFLLCGLAAGLLARPAFATDAPVQTAAVRAYPPLFGTREIRNPNTGAFGQWTAMVARQRDERAAYDGPCTASWFNRCHLQEWRRFLGGLAGRDRMTQIVEVNRFLNAAPYVTDPVNYGVPDYWASPRQFMAKDGDCEDYAIAKFYSLQELGFPAADMRVVVVDDMNLRVPHAVLVVYVDGEALILDNQIPQVVRADAIRHYRPIYSINYDGWWLHQP